MNNPTLTAADLDDPPEVEEDAETFECSHCGCTLDEDDATWHDDIGDVCRECFYDNVSTCQICGDEEVCDSQLSAYILVKAEFSGDRPPGIFRVLRRPFMSIPLIGNGHLHTSDVAWVAPLPKPSHDYDSSGHICKACSKPYEAIWKRVYQYAPRAKSYGPKVRWNKVKKPGQRHHGKTHRHYWWPHKHWLTERAHTRRHLLKHPAILRDFESPLIINPDTGYKHTHLHNIESIYSIDLSRRRTWHDWTLFRYKGVSIYGCYSIHDKLGSWLMLDPDPLKRCLSYRNRNPYAVLVPYCLPTFPKESISESGYSYIKNDIAKKAIIEAIDQGLLRQDGVYARDGSRIICS
jgi:hypothetical protein